jgi:hypothetical protein
MRREQRNWNYVLLKIPMKEQHLPDLSACNRNTGSTKTGFWETRVYTYSTEPEKNRMWGAYSEKSVIIKYQCPRTVPSTAWNSGLSPSLNTTWRVLDSCEEVTSWLLSCFVPGRSHHVVIGYSTDFRKTCLHSQWNFALVIDTPGSVGSQYTGVVQQWDH